MTRDGKSDTRTDLLQAAADLISASPGRDVPLRAICDRVGVKLPTLYHFFGSKEGLLDAVVAHGFDLYLAQKSSGEPASDAVEAIRDGWDTHASFGVTHAGFYALMYGKAIPGYRPAPQETATRILGELLEQAQLQGRLTVDPAHAADHVLAANVGLTLHLITSSEPDWELSARVRDATIAAITGESQAAVESPASVSDAASRLLRALSAEADAGERLLSGDPERALLRKWLGALARDPGDASNKHSHRH